MSTVRKVPDEHGVSEIQNLRNTIEQIDSLSQGGFSEIASIAKLALYSLETPEGYKHMDNLINAFQIIWEKAENIKECISYEAEQFDCCYKMIVINVVGMPNVRLKQILTIVD